MQNTARFMNITNILLRQCIPKKRSMSTVTVEEIRMLQKRLNNRSRKTMELNISAEVFYQSLKRVQLRSRMPFLILLCFYFKNCIKFSILLNLSACALIHSISLFHHFNSCKNFISSCENRMRITVAGTPATIV
jgi:hypothetical protein